MRIGILCAIPEELRHFPMNSLPAVRLGGKNYFQAKHNPHELVLVESGIGKVNSAVASTILIQHFNCEILIFSGVAGGLDPSLQIGDLVIAEELWQHDYGTIIDRELIAHRAGTLPLGIPKKNLPFRLDGELKTKIQQAYPEAHFGRILSGDTFLNCKETRQQLFEKFQAQAVEMEGAAIAQVAEQFGVCCIIVRSLSDLSGEESMGDFPTFLKEAAAKSYRVVNAILGVL
jgi:adenosylhomocysteine nucleosidase